MTQEHQSRLIQVEAKHLFLHWPSCRHAIRLLAAEAQLNEIYHLFVMVMMDIGGSISCDFMSEEGPDSSMLDLYFPL